MSNSGLSIKRLLLVLLPGWLGLGGAVGIGAEIEVKLDNPPATGKVVLVLFDSANAFGDLRDPVAQVEHALDGRAVFRLENIAPGEYALLVYYDENGNRQVDRNFIGIPKEPLGFSNRYSPKGPPSYRRASFLVEEDALLKFDVALKRPLGERGRLGVGIGLIARSSPYRGYDGGVYQVIPALTYMGERFQILGPNLRLGLWGSGKVRLAATGSYRVGVYEEDESDFLVGMGDRQDTFMAGLALQAELPGGVDFSIQYAHDALDEIGGGESRLGFDKSFQFGIVRCTPAVGLNWVGAKLADHDFGVPAEKALPGRSAYTLDDTISLEGGVGLFIEFSRNWQLILNASVERFDDDITQSPIVDENFVLKGFCAMSYVF